MGVALGCGGRFVFVQALPRDAVSRTCLDPGKPVSPFGNVALTLRLREMANLITLMRLLLLFVLVAMVYWASPVLQLINAPLILLIIALDGLDGFVARRRGETSLFGSIFDIAVDRVVETVMWLVLANVGLVPVWVAIVFLTRGAIVDTIRHSRSDRGKSAYEDLHHGWRRWLVASRFMRGAYGGLKAGTFAWILFFQPWPALFPQTWLLVGPVALAISHGLVLASVAVCIARAIPVILEVVPLGGTDDRPRIVGG